MSNVYKTNSSSNSNHSDDLYSHIVRNVDDLEDNQSDQTSNYYDHQEHDDDIENEDLNDVLRASVAFDPEEDSDLYSHNINQRDETDSNSSDFYSTTTTSTPQTVSPAPPYSAYADKKERATSPYRVQPDLRDLRLRIQSLTASQYKHQLDDERGSGRTTPSPRDIYSQTFVTSAHSSQSSASSNNSSYHPQLSDERVRTLSAEERKSRRGSSSLAPARSELSAYQKLQTHNKRLVELSSELLRTLRREVSRISEVSERDAREKKLNEMEGRVLDVVHKSKKVKEERGERRDWNELFQSALDMPQDSVVQQIARYEKIIDVAQNFERTAQVFGKIIISEVFLPYKYKTIKPVSELGGHAGGEKYIYNGILYKFAVDWKGIYSGDEYAMKAAGHEMRSLIAFYNYGQPIGLRVPLIALVNYLGFRLVALSILPISRHTIVYGSCDGGQNVYKSHDRVAHLMKRVAKRLKLKKHKAGVDVELAKTLPYPCDIETHVGRDGRFYTLDFARLMPPTTPDARYKESYLYQQFRPEFMKRYKHALSPDAFSPKFDMHEVDRTAHQLEISEATDYLRDTLIPQFAKTLDMLFRKSIRHELSNLIHREGINVRYLAVLRRHCQSSYLKNVIMIEMVARGVKNHLRHLLRETKKQLKAWGLQPYHEVVVRCFNQLLGHGASREECALFWSELRARLEMQFEQFPSDEELLQEHEECVDKIAAAVANDICTFKATGPTGTKQLWYQCFTCQLVKNQVVCEVCARKCHKNHEISPLRGITTPHYCECGSTGVFCSARVRTLSEEGGFMVRPKEEESSESRDTNTNHVLGDIKLLVEPLARPNDPLLQIDEDLQILGPIKNKLKSMGWLQVFERIEELSGIKLTADVKRVLQQNEHDLTFVLPDVQKIMLKSRPMPLVTFAEANLLHLQSFQQSNAFAQQRLFDLSMHKFDKSVKANPDNEEIILAYAAALKQHAYRAQPIDFKLLTRAVLKYQSIKHLGEIKSVVADLYERRALLETDTNSVYFEQYRNLLQRCYDILCSDRHWMRQRASLEFLSTHCTYLTQLDLSHSTLLNHALVAQFAQNCTELRSLRLKQTAHVNDDLVCLFVSNLASLSVLELEDLPITDESVEYISARCLQLQSWVMRSCSHVSNLTALQQLTALRIIDISHCTRITDLSPLKHCPNIEDVNITGCTQITEESLRAIIANCPRLSKMILDGCMQVHDSLIKELVQQSICLEYISLLNCVALTEKTVEHLALAPKLDTVLVDERLKERAEQLLHVNLM